MASLVRHREVRVRKVEGGAEWLKLVECVCACRTTVKDEERRGFEEPQMDCSVGSCSSSKRLPNFQSPCSITDHHAATKSALRKHQQQSRRQRAIQTSLQWSAAWGEARQATHNTRRHRLGTALGATDRLPNGGCSIHAYDTKQPTTSNTV